MIQRSLLLALLFVLLFGIPATAQPLSVDAKAGLSFFSGGGGSSTGFLLGGALDIPMQENLFIRPEFNLTTHGGTPIEIAAILKYNLPTSPLSSPVYVDGGLGLWFDAGGSALGLDFGCGTLLSPSESGIQIPVEIRLGPIFESGTTVFQIACTSGIRFSLPN